MKDLPINKWRKSKSIQVPFQDIVLFYILWSMVLEIKFQSNSNIYTIFWVKVGFVTIKNPIWVRIKESKNWTYILLNRYDDADLMLLFTETLILYW